MTRCTLATDARSRQSFGHFFSKLFSNLLNKNNANVQKLRKLSRNGPQSQLTFAAEYRSIHRHHFCFLFFFFHFMSNATSIATRWIILKANTTFYWHGVLWHLPHKMTPRICLLEIDAFSVCGCHRRIHAVQYDCDYRRQNVLRYSLAYIVSMFQYYMLPTFCIHNTNKWVHISDIFAQK